jgi:hypothetical protein
MSEQTAENDVTHWGGDDLRPTSLHGNGAASFDHVTREGRVVTCCLCQSLLGKCDGSSAREATVHIHGCYADRDGAPCDDPDDHDGRVTPPARPEDR